MGSSGSQGSLVGIWAMVLAFASPVFAETKFEPLVDGTSLESWTVEGLSLIHI